MMNIVDRFRRSSLVSTALIFAILAANGAKAPAVAQTTKSQSAPPPTSAAQTDVMGVWMDHTGRGAVEIVPCGTKVCGFIYWVKDTVAKQGKPVLDIKNPDPKQRNQPICGTQVLINLAQEKPARIGHIWGSGSIYDPEQGEKFDAEIKLISENELSVLGYLGMKFLGETFTWKRAPIDLARCGPARV